MIACAEAVLVTSQTAPEKLSTVASTRDGNGPPELAQPEPLELEDEPLEFDELEADVDPPPLLALVLAALELLEPLLVLAALLELLFAEVETVALEVELAVLPELLPPDVELDAGHEHVPNVPLAPQVWTPVGPPRHAQLEVVPGTQLAGPVFPEEQPATPPAKTAIKAADLESPLI